MNAYPPDIRRTDNTDAFRLPFAAKQEYMRHITDRRSPAFKVYVEKTTSSASAQPSEQDVDTVQGIIDDKNASAMLTDLALLFAHTPKDPDFAGPSLYALATTWSVLDGVWLKLDGMMPMGTVYGDGDGGIRVEWTINNRELRLIIPETRSERKYIYHQAGNLYGTDYDVSMSSLARWLDWLSGDDESYS